VKLGLVLLLTSISAAAEPLKLVVPDFNAVGPTKEKAQFFTEHISGRLAEVGASVTTARALQSLIGIERQKQLLGCASEGSSCIAELASALGSDALLLGDIAQIETLFQVNLKVINGSNGKVLASYQARVSSEAALLDELDRAAFSLVSDAATALHRDAPRPLKGRGVSLRLVAIAPLAVGVVSAALSAVFFAQAQSRWVQIPMKAGDVPLPTETVVRLGQEGSMFKTAGWVCASIGIAGLVAAGILFIVGRPPPVKAAVVGSSSGASLVLMGEL
jgi:hypothetical protein